jgi:putative restriction endonuclease
MITEGKVRKINNYSDGSSYMEIHFHKRFEPYMPINKNTKKLISLKVGNHDYEAGISHTDNNKYIWINPTCRLNGSQVRLSDILKSAGFVNKDSILIEFHGENAVVLPRKTMTTVETWDDISINIATLERYSSSTEDEMEFHAQLIKKGTCFIAYQINKKIHFAPSRFVGYKGNNIYLHKANKFKDGRITNPAISIILDNTPQINIGLEFEYRKYCESLGFVARKVGSFGVVRKFWFSNLPEVLLQRIKNSSTEDKCLLSDLQEISNQQNVENTEKEQLVSARVGQGLYREGLIKYWQKCAVTKCDEVAILRASHIKPWRYSSNQERLDIFNGLLLAPNLDILFDKGFISFDSHGNIQISHKMKDDNLKKLGINNKMRIHLHKKHQPYLKWHRKNIFIK